MQKQQQQHRPMLYALYIFNRRCECIFYRNYCTANASSQAQAAATAILPTSKSNSNLAQSQIAAGFPLINSQQQQQQVDSPVDVEYSSTAKQQQSELNSNDYEAKNMSNNNNTDSLVAADGMPWEEHAKLIYGLLFSLTNTINKLATRQPQEGLLSFRTNSYRLFYYAPGSGLKFVALTEPTADISSRQLLQQLYAQVYVEYVVKNPLAGLILGPSSTKKQQQPSLMSNELFQHHLEQFVAINFSRPAVSMNTIAVSAASTSNQPSTSNFLMGLCKCRTVTNLFCFVHRKNVCEKCMLTEHQTCIVRSYMQWLRDSDYDSSCNYCRQPLANDSPVIRLTCLDLMHVECVNKMCNDLPEHTTNAGYACPLCNTAIMPPDNAGSQLAQLIRQTFVDSPWAKRLAMLSNLQQSSGTQQQSTQSIPQQQQQQPPMDTRIQIPSPSIRRHSNPNDPDDAKYDRKSTSSGVLESAWNSVLAAPLIFKRRLTIRRALVLLVLLTLVFMLWNAAGHTTSRSSVFRPSESNGAKQTTSSYLDSAAATVGETGSGGGNDVGVKLTVKPVARLMDN